jgi:hypothetical protein
MGNSKSLADFVKEHNEAGFYSTQNPFYLPGAQYPQKSMLTKPLFAVAINSKLQKKDKDGVKSDVKYSQMTDRLSRTAIFFERGLPGESRAHPTISKSDYDGSCKGTAKKFVARYTEKGVIAFLDGSAREFAGKDLLDSSGSILWDQNDPSSILWTVDPTSNPN